MSDSLQNNDEHEPDPTDYLDESIVSLIYRIGRSQERLKTVMDIEELPEKYREEFIDTENRLTERYLTTLVIRRAEFKSFFCKLKRISGTQKDVEALMKMIDLGGELMRKTLKALVMTVYESNPEYFHLDADEDAIQKQIDEDFEELLQAEQEMDSGSNDLFPEETQA